MKFYTTLLALAIAATFAVAGCSKKADGTVNVDTSKIEAAFASADAATKSAADSAVAAIKGADYSGAITQLQSLGEKFKLTDEQQAAVKEVIAGVQQAVSDAAGKATDAASKTADGAAKALGK